MKLTIKWRYPDEETIHENVFYDINPAKTVIRSGVLYFEAMETPEDNHWTIALCYIIETKWSEE